MARLSPQHHLGLRGPAPEAARVPRPARPLPPPQGARPLPLREGLGVLGLALLAQPQMTAAVTRRLPRGAHLSIEDASSLLQFDEIHFYPHQQKEEGHWRSHYFAGSSFLK